VSTEDLNDLIERLRERHDYWEKKCVELKAMKEDLERELHYYREGGQ